MQKTHGTPYLPSTTIISTPNKPRFGIRGHKSILRRYCDLQSTIENPQPTNGWLALDQDGTSLPSDWHLRLTGEAQLMLEGKRTLTSTIPLNPNVPHIPRTAKTATTPNKPTLHPTNRTRRSRQPTTIPVIPTENKAATTSKTTSNDFMVIFTTDDRRLERQRINRHLLSQITAHSTEPKSNSYLVHNNRNHQARFAMYRSNELNRYLLTAFSSIVKMKKSKKLQVHCVVNKALS